MKIMRNRAGWLLAACGALTIGACNNLPTVTPTASESGNRSESTRQLMAIETDTPPEDVTTLEAQLPERISEAEAQTLLKGLAASAVDEADEVAFDLKAWGPRGMHGYRGGSWSHSRSWTRGFAPRWRGSWSNYLYYPVGSYYFPYFYSAGNYWRYRSAYAPFFYYTDGWYRPYYRSRWW